jgi:hypothetical protein
MGTRMGGYRTIGGVWANERASAPVMNNVEIVDYGRD